MRHMEFIDKLISNPVVAAVKNDDELDLAIKIDTEVIFVLYGNVCSIVDVTKRLKAAGKTVMLHLDLINGLSPREESIDFIKKYTDADGIITTKGNLIPYAKKLGLNTILRYFVLDSMSIINIEKQSGVDKVQPDIIEILPGVVVPKIIKRINSISRVPVMAGGLIREREDIINAIDSGAIAISTTNRSIWDQ